MKNTRCEFSDSTLTCCTPVLAWYVWLHQSEFVDKTVLELGSGTALPGLLCSKLGAKKVFLSDDFWQPNTLKNCHEAIKVNNLPESKATVLGLTWGEYSKSGLLSSQVSSLTNCNPNCNLNVT